MANVEILRVGHALIAGTRGENGGAPSKDSIWGVALVQGNVVKFYGRRGGIMRYKTEKRTELDKALAMFQDKLAGKGKHYSYAEVTGDQIEALVPNLAEVVGKGFYKAMGTGKLNTRATKPAPKAKKAEAVVDVVAA